MGSLALIQAIHGTTSQTDNIYNCISRLQTKEDTVETLQTMHYWLRNQKGSSYKLTVLWYAFARYTVRFTNLNGCRKNGDMFTISFNKKYPYRENMMVVKKIFARFGGIIHNYRIGKTSATFYLISRERQKSKALGNIF